jgi:hypothetical protein
MYYKIINLELLYIIWKIQKNIKLQKTLVLFFTRIFFI